MCFYRKPNTKFKNEKLSKKIIKFRKPNKKAFV